VLLVAHRLAKLCLPDYSSKFSRHDFTLPQLFACLVLREHQKKSYRGVVALLRDCPEWCAAIGLEKVPAHTTLCVAFGVLTNGQSLASMIDQVVEWMRERRTLGDTIAIDSTLMDVSYRSRHYEQRCRHMADPDRKTADKKRSKSAKRTPKLTVAVDSRSHIILSHKTRTGMGSDAPDFAPTLRAAVKRNPRAKHVLADAGYDSHNNHRIAREELGVRSLIKTGAGRPTTKAPTSHYRRLMKRQLAGSQAGKPYGQRAQAETVNSMLKRNLGDHLRSRSTRRRKAEMSLRALVHNIMVFRRARRRV
jgi:hypothetical protein